MMVMAMMKKPMLAWKEERESGKVGRTGRDWEITCRNIFSSYCSKAALAYVPV